MYFSFLFFFSIIVIACTRSTCSAFPKVKLFSNVLLLQTTIDNYSHQIILNEDMAQVGANPETDVNSLTPVRTVSST